MLSMETHSMPSLGQQIEEWLLPGTFVRAHLQCAGGEHSSEGLHLRARPVAIRGRRLVQLALRTGPREVHENLVPEDAAARLVQLLESPGTRAEIATTEAIHTFVREASGQLKVRSRPAATPPPSVEHDHRPHHILPEGLASPALHSLGVTKADGRVVAAMRDKHRQINRFLEIVRDVYDALPAEGTLRVLDLACGKAYLTFALYEYLAEHMGREVVLTGVERRADLVQKASALATQLGYDGLHFAHGSIRDCVAPDSADLVVALHACDTATDEALALAVRSRARVILAAPCCQHSLRRKIRPANLRALARHPLLQERFAALATDALRAAWLETRGYGVQVVEFVDPEHTPKNLLLRATLRRGGPSPGSCEAYQNLLDALGIEEDPFTQPTRPDLNEGQIPTSG